MLCEVVTDDVELPICLVLITSAVWFVNRFGKNWTGESQTLPMRLKIT